MLFLRNTPAVLASVLLLASQTVSGAAIKRDSSISLNVRQRGPPGPGEIPVCPMPAVIDGENPDPDPDTADPELFAEAVEGEDTCSTPAGNPVASARDLFSRSESVGALEDRASARNVQFCVPGQPQVAIPIIPYPGVLAVSAAPNKGFIYADDEYSCGAVGLIVKPGRPMNVNFVVEHVFEAQSVRNYLEKMISGTLQSGAALPQGAASVPGIFDANGIFFQNWPATVVKPAFGANPRDSAMGALGHRAVAGGQVDMGNLQVLQQDLNSYKNYVVSHKNFVSPQRYATYDAHQKMHLLSSIQNVFAYMQLDQVIQSYNLAYRGLFAFWETFAKVPGAQPNYDYVGAFVAIVADDLNQQLVDAKQKYQAIITDLTNYFNSPQSAGEDPYFKQDAMQTLQNLAGSVDTAIAYDITSMTSTVVELA